MFVQGGVFKQDLTGKLFGTGQNCSFKRGVRLTRVFVRRGSTVYYKPSCTSPAGSTSMFNKALTSTYIMQKAERQSLQEQKHKNRQINGNLKQLSHWTNGLALVAKKALHVKNPVC